MRGKAGAYIEDETGIRLDESDPATAERLAAQTAAASGKQIKKKGGEKNAISEE